MLYPPTRPLVAPGSAWVGWGPGRGAGGRAAHVLVELVLGGLQGAPGLGVVGDHDGGPGATQLLEQKVVHHSQCRGRGVVRLVVEQGGDHCPLTDISEGHGHQAPLAKATSLHRGPENQELLQVACGRQWQGQWRVPEVAALRSSGGLRERREGRLLVQTGATAMGPCHGSSGVRGCRASGHPVADGLTPLLPHRCLRRDAHGSSLGQVGVAGRSRSGEGEALKGRPGRADGPLGGQQVHRGGVARGEGRAALRGRDGTGPLPVFLVFQFLWRKYPFIIRKKGRCLKRSARGSEAFPGQLKHPSRPPLEVLAPPGIRVLRSHGPPRPAGPHLAPWRTRGEEGL